MRRAFLAALVLAASCGGGPMSPSTPTPSTPFLQAGAYTLTLGHGTIFTCQNGICTSVTFCIGPPAAPSSASFEVTVQRDGDRALVIPVSAADSFRMSLQVAASPVSGSVSGSVSGTMSNANAVTVAASGTVVGGASSVTNGAAGLLDGEVSIGGASCSGTQYNWSLAPR